jgi:hypothetical protein
MAAEEVTATHDGMVDAFAEESDARRRLLHAICEIVAPAIPAISEGTRKILVPDGPCIETHCVQLDARGGISYYLTGDQYLWRLCRSHEHDERVLVSFDRTAPIPRKLRLDEAVRHLGERLRSALHGGATDRRAEARDTADRLNAIAVLLANR